VTICASRRDKPQARSGSSQQALRGRPRR
jgi:hypothetical protein